MSHKSTSSLKKRSRFSSLVAVAGYLSLCVPSSAVLSAEQEWWFDVEVIVFKRNVSLGDISEKFPLAPPSLPAADNVDLLTKYLIPDLSYLLQNLAVCNEPMIPPDYWGPAPLLTNQSSEVNSLDEDVIQNNSLTNTVESGVTATQVNLKDTGLQADRRVDSDASHPQDPLVIELAKEVSQAESVTSQKIAHFTAESILASFVDLELPSQFPCTFPEQVSLLTNPFVEVMTQVQDSRLSKMLSVPVKIDGVELVGSNHPYLLPQTLLTLSELFADINRQQDLLPLLHVGWRQEVLFGHDQAKAFRLFAGKNFANRFAASGELLVDPLESTPENDVYYIPADEFSDASPVDSVIKSPVDSEIRKPAVDDLFTKISKALADDSPIIVDELTNNNPVELPVQETLSALWELDGKLKVYLQYVGRTPYLHIDTNLEYRSPVFIASKHPKQEENNQSSIVVGKNITEANYLQSVKFDQLRRVISKQLHYFDHPLFGMIVHITRYERPEPEPEPEPEPKEPVQYEEQSNSTSKRVTN